MSVSSNVAKQTIKKKGYWNYSELYGFCFNWLKDNGYGVKESEYVEKLSDFGKEIQLKWEGGRRVTDYFKFVIKVEWHILGMTDAVIERDGKQEKTNKGEIKLSISADLVKDYEDNWDKKPMVKFMRGIYDKYIIRTTIDNYEDVLKSDFKEYISQVKSFLELI
ncbi:MAG: hypothetical protein PHX15_01545 [Candidatus Nanoarchaeia archaeon]|jgi:hypothetical protein|nr:hypothetical protein [Candidatus Nanoarchaeia archaeon]MDD3993859.1 hypothetical protein [Candidatus Nanoarchaeia archaeon]